MKFDFGGYATKNNLKCSDGRTIMQDAFKECSGKTVPLVWNHLHDSPYNVLGHALLENRKDGVYAYCTLNDTEAGDTARSLVKSSDVNALSIYANHLRQNGSNVVHGDIKEVSLVLAGANPGAMIDNITIQHSDGSSEDLEDEAVFYSDSTDIESDISNDISNDISHADSEVSKENSMGNVTKDTKDTKDTADTSAKKDDPTVQDIYDSMTDEQKQVCNYLVGVALEQGEDDTDDGDESADDETAAHSDEEYDMHHNIFEGNTGDTDGSMALSHSDMNELFEDTIHDAKICGSFHDSLLAHAENDYGIKNVNILFPDATNLRDQPDILNRQQDWVSDVMNTTTHSPFARIRTTVADITEDDARAKGYIKGNKKIEEFFSVAKRETTPTTIYKKQKLDRDDVLDITSFDVVNFIRGEMRIKLNEEIARAILIGDGRSASSVDKINEQNIRPVVTDDDLFAVKVELSDTAVKAGVADYSAVVEEISKAHHLYEGSGNPMLFTSVDIHSGMSWVKDTLGRRLYPTEAELCSALRVSKIVEVPYMADFVRTDAAGKKYNVFGIKVNLSDYNVGADKGGEINNFDDFDIDYNQYKYLMETRCSGALTRPHCAEVIEKVTTTA